MIIFVQRSEIFFLFFSIEMSDKTNKRLTREVVKKLFHARVFLPGLTDRNVCLWVFIFLPFLDYATDWNNAGTRVEL